MSRSGIILGDAVALSHRNVHSDVETWTEWLARDGWRP
jgi:hypothetical protein